MKKKISVAEVEQLSRATQYDFPKYTTQIINLVNSNAQGTRPNVVGQMSELIQEFNGSTLEEWIAWYSQKQPNAIMDATNKIYVMFLKMREAFEKIDKTLIENWVKDLVYTKTYCGLKFQECIIAYIANSLQKTYRLANIEEEGKGIDGFIGETPIQVKSTTYKLEEHLSEVITVPIVYYDKKKDGIVIEYNPKDFQK
ncbi:MAG: MjaI family restriction endonuclease [Paludibacteraceae bacterium]|nr:MjaI family restriction endonuclease [Paludibacteraceae bacterium]